MSKNFVQSGLAREVGLWLYRLQKSAKIWRRGPAILVNSIPKSGTHLLIELLASFPEIEKSGLHIRTWRVNRNGTGPLDNLDFELDGDSLAATLGSVRGRQVATCHLPWSDDVPGALDGLDLRTIFMVRDPRDVLASDHRYIIGLKRHHLYPILTGIDGEAAQLKALVLGRDGDDGTLIRPLAERLRDYAGWIGQPGVLTVRFEDLLGTDRGGSDVARHAAISHVAEHIGVDTPGDLSNRLSKAGSRPNPTLRRGRAGTWRDELPPEIQDLLATELGDVLEQLGYPA